MVIICRDTGYFLLALFYLENLMGDFQYKMLFSVKVRGGNPPPPHAQCFLYTSFFIFS